MKANRARWPIATMARLLQVSTGGYYAWLVREPSKQVILPPYNRTRSSA
jgi:putative transposase